MEAPDLTARNTAACGMVTVSERKATSVVAMPAKLRESGSPMVATGVPPTKTCAAGELEVPGTGGDTRTIRHTTLMVVGAVADPANLLGVAVTSMDVCACPCPSASRRATRRERESGG